MGVNGRGSRAKAIPGTLKLIGVCLLLSGLLLAIPSAAYSAGELDTSFGDGGIVRVTEGDSLFNPTGTVDGDRILVAASEPNGNSAALVTLIFDQDGSLVETNRYGGTRVSDYEFTPYALKVDGAGKILIGGRAFGVPGSDFSDLGLVRLNPDGSLDTTFGDAGIATVDLGLANEWAVDVAADSQGRYLLINSGPSTSLQLTVVRITSNGETDPSFGIAGSRTVAEVGQVHGSGIIADDQDRVIALYAAPALSGGGVLRLTSAGSLDLSFGDGGHQVAPFGDGGTVEGVGMDDSGRILIAGGVRAGPGEPEAMGVARFDTSGDPDMSFGDSGVATAFDGNLTAAALDVVVDPSGFVLAGGLRVDGTNAIEAVLASFTSAGELDAEVVIPPAGDSSAIHELAVDDVGRAVVVGRDWESQGSLVESVMVARFARDAFGFSGTFSDDDTSVFENAIEWLAAEGITEGCNPPVNDRFCPGDPVTRGQMAAFLARAFGYSDIGTGDYFTDTADSVFKNAIDRLRVAGVTVGCNPPQNDEYCPDGFVTRGQMAAFLVRAFGFTDSGTGDFFTDTTNSVFKNAIDRLRVAGVTQGCNPPDNDEYCPDDRVTRGQMAAFLKRGFGQ